MQFCIAIVSSASEGDLVRRLRGAAQADVAPKATNATLQRTEQQPDITEAAAIWDDLFSNPTTSHSFAVWLGDLDAESRQAWERNISDMSLAQNGAEWWPRWHPHPWHHGWHHWHHWGPGPHWHHWYVSEETLNNASDSIGDTSLAQGEWWGPHWHPHPWFHRWHHGWHHWHPAWHHWHRWFATEATLGNTSGADFTKAQGPGGEIDAGEALDNNAFWNTVLGDATLMQGFAAWLGRMDKETREAWETSLFHPPQEESGNVSSNVSEMSLAQATAEWWGPHWHPHHWHPHPGFHGWHHGWHHWGHGPHWHHWFVSEESSDNVTSNLSEASLVQASAAWWGPHWHPHHWHPHPGWHHGWHHWGHGPHWRHWYASEAMMGETPEVESNESALSEALTGNV